MIGLRRAVREGRLSRCWVTEVYIKRGEATAKLESGSQGPSPAFRSHPWHVYQYQAVDAVVAHRRLDKLSNANIARK